MGASPSKGRVEIDAKRQAWVRTRPNPAHPKHQGLNRTQSVAGVRPQTTRRQQHYDIPPTYYQQEPERPTHGHGDEGRNRHDERGLRRAQSTRSQSRSHGPFFDDESDDEAGVPLHRHRHQGSMHQNSRGFSGGRHGSRGISHGPGQQGYDFAPPVEHMRAQYSASRSQRGSEHDSQYAIQHGSHRGSEHDSQHGIRHSSHRSSQRSSQ